MCILGVCVPSDILIFAGPSKKKAKHNAALSVLTQMMGITNGQPQMVEDYK